MSIERYKLIESNVNTVKAPKIVGAKLERTDGAVLTDSVPDAPDLPKPVLHSLRQLSPAEIGSAVERAKSATAGGSLINREDLKGEYQPYTHG